MKPCLARSSSEDGGTCHCGQRQARGTFAQGSQPPSSTTPSQPAKATSHPTHIRATLTERMFRRIEFILPGGILDGESSPAEKGGLLSVVSGPVAEAWWDSEGVVGLLGPARSSLPPNCRFYFTEKGWRDVGRRVVAAARQTGEEICVVAIKETDAQVVWRDKARDYEVAVQPPSRRPRSRVPDLGLA